MYRQILICPEQQDLQRIVWRDDPSKPIKHFKLKTITYGLKPAAQLAIRTLQELAQQDGSQYSSEAATALCENFYVDDYLQSFRTLEEALDVSMQLKELLKGGGFPLTSWCSNSKQFMDHIEEGERALAPPDLFAEDTTVKTLGLHWIPSADQFTYKLKENHTNSLTKRQILSEIASFFDPMNYIAPVIVKAKIIMQKLWLLKTDWDEEVSPEILHKWTNFKKELIDVCKIKIPRQFCSSISLKRPYLHIFCDASELAYGCCAYLSCEENGRYSSSLVCSKAKVDPLKVLSIPKLELCSAVLAAELAPPSRCVYYFF